LLCYFLHFFRQNGRQSENEVGQVRGGESFQSDGHGQQPRRHRVLQNLNGGAVGEHGGDPGTTNSLRLRLLCSLRLNPMDDDPVEGRGELEEVLQQPAAASHQRILRTDVHLRAVLDLLVRDGSRLLVPTNKDYINIMLFRITKQRRF